VKALVLAAGQGSRLRPLTNDRPKCLVELLGRSLLARQADTFANCGVSEIAVVGGYQIEKIRELGFSCFENERFASTNMVESLFAARDYLSGPEDLIISYGDIVYEPENLRRLMAVDAEISLMVDVNWREYWSQRLTDPLSDAETLKFKGGDFLAELGKKPQSYDEIEAQYTGLIKIRGDVLRAFCDFYDALDRAAIYDGQSFENMYLTSFLQMLIDAGWPVRGVREHGGWLEIDTISDLTLYENLAKTHELDVFCKLEQY
jgi:choline kinase